ncbi:peptide chain release factor 1 [Holospora curviuscula]|uniref:Peptide chain release factor 1 n=1 Tax=Holospora curviuscula TaxID=1082868 RepID=A0A2S5REE5_9PROT|nr:peptide chain release factor 1 [Holospora curviuscula]PPE05693.1 Peptide chain release factor 1 [Holospora curviuscula]
MHGISSQTLFAILERHKRLENALLEDQSLQNAIQINKDYAAMTPLVECVQKWFQVKKEYENLVQMQEIEEDIKLLVEEEKKLLRQRLEALSYEIRILLLPKDEDDARGAILEIRAGTGGEEAALFAADLMRMYTRYGTLQKWKIEILHVHYSDHAGVKDVGLLIQGKDVYAQLKFEAGVHRVQRVPKTESSGRVHTSAATVAVLPEVEEIDIVIDEKDLRIDVFRSSGPGGQSVNTTDSAVRITHLPTGIVVSQQDEKSQHKNKAKALKVLRSRLYDAKKYQEDMERSQSRQQQVGRGDRSERIRTYNFPQGRLTDHRIKLTLHYLPEILEGERLGEVITALMTYARAEQLAEQEMQLSSETSLS